MAVLSMGAMIQKKLEHLEGIMSELALGACHPASLLCPRNATPLIRERQRAEQEINPVYLFKRSALSWPHALSCYHHSVPIFSTPRFSILSPVFCILLSYELLLIIYLLNMLLS
jgi:hypothetical protein